MIRRHRPRSIDYDCCNIEKKLDLHIILIGETGASCYTGNLLQSKYFARWCIDAVALCKKVPLPHTKRFTLTQA